MEILDALEKRWSCRSYLNRKLRESQILALVNAGTLAPNAGNLQNWNFIIVRDDNIKEKLTKAALNQRWMMQADLFLVLCSDSSPSKKTYQKRGEEYNIQNCSAAAENILLAALSMNLAGCWVSAFEEDAVSRALKLPDNVKPHIILTIGYPDEKPAQKRRCHLEAVTHFNEYGKKATARDFLKELKSYLAPVRIKNK